MTRHTASVVAGRSRLLRDLARFKTRLQFRVVAVEARGVCVSAFAPRKATLLRPQLICVGPLFFCKTVNV
jgi:hypothetical protein